LAGLTLEQAMPTQKSRTQTTNNVLILSERTHSEDGVDLTLIRWMLSLTPAERLQVLQDNLVSILRLRGDKA